jgi:integrase
VRLKWYRGKWAIVWSEGGHTRRSSTGQTDHALAEIALREFQHKLATAGQAGPETVGSIVDRYLKAHPGRIYRPALVKWWRAHLPEHVTQQTVDGYLAHRQGRAPSTLRSEVGIVLTALKWARKPLPILDQLPPESPPRERWITREEAERLVAEAKTPHMKLFTMLTIYTGARAGAILSLTWDRVTERYIDYNDPTKPRTRKKRAVVPVHPELWPALVEGRQLVDGDHVIQYGDRPIKTVKKAFGRQAKRAGLPGIGPHTLRHSVATWMAMEGVTMRKIADFLGNSEKMVERVYAKFAPGYLADAVAVLGRGQVVQLNRSLADKPETASKIEPTPARKSK